MTFSSLPWWRPERFARRRAGLELRARLMMAFRQYFAHEGFIEVDTPVLQRSPCMEPHLAAFATRYETPRGQEYPLYLATSPEFTCKKLLVAGVERLYQLSHMFRNGEGSSRHHPEFMLLEWYRAHEGAEALMQDCEKLLRITAALSGKAQVVYRGLSCDITQDAERLTVAGAFQRYCGIDLLGTMDGAFESPSPARLKAQAQRLGVHVADDDAWDDIVLRLLAEKIEPFLGAGRPAFLMDYPLPMAALAKPHTQDPRLAQRFELYIAGMEMANAFVELTDPVVQRARFEADMRLRAARYGQAYPLEEDFLAALAHGMPDAAGIALGFDRLMMLAAGTENITDILWAPVAFTDTP